MSSIPPALQIPSPSPLAPQGDARLLGEARAAYPQLEYEDLTHDVLADLSSSRGVDFATALFYDRVCRSPKNADFIREVAAIEPDSTTLPRVSGELLVAPAAFWKEYPQYGGDGRLVRRIAATFGMETRVAPVPSTASVTRAAEIIAETLQSFDDGQVVLASLSKGGADVRLVLQRRPQLAKKLRVWLQVAGPLHGSPVVNELLNGSWWRRGLVRGYLAHTRADPQFLRELARGQSDLLSGRAVAPPGVTVINVVGFPLSNHLCGNVAKRHQRMSRLGPNDGSTLLRDAIVEGGLIYPVWGADHYMRVPQIERILRQLFVYIARRT
jgi:hypothetical protein